MRKEQDLHTHHVLPPIASITALCTLLLFLCASARPRAQDRAAPCVSTRPQCHCVILHVQCQQLPGWSAQDEPRKLEGEQTRLTATFSQLNCFSKLALSDRAVQSVALLLF